MIKNYSFAEDNFKNDLGLWTAINLNAPITKKIESRFQFSPRWTDNITGFNQFILHALLGYKFNDHFSFFQGYAWSTTYIPGFKSEQRPYQELDFSHKLKKILFDHRIRFEERFLEDVDRVSLRFRYKITGTYPLGKSSKWSLVLFDELFLNLNSQAGGPFAGIDQNRIYAGLNRKLTEYLSTEFGYQLQHSHKPSLPTDTLNHFIVFYLNLNLPVIAEMSK